MCSLLQLKIMVHLYSTQAIFVSTMRVEETSRVSFIRIYNSKHIIIYVFVLRYVFSQLKSILKKNT